MWLWILAGLAVLVTVVAGLWWRGRSDAQPEQQSIGVRSLPPAFGGPYIPSDRRHGPVYQDYQSYRPWLRDEFEYRCAYCQTREAMVHALMNFEIDHLIPQTDPAGKSRAADYVNLVYACNACNRAKGKEALSKIEEATFHCGADGWFEESEQNIFYIRALGINAADRVRWRRKMLHKLQLLIDAGDEEGLCAELGYPTDLPNLKATRPNANTRPEGILASAYERRRRGALPPLY